MKEPSAAPRAYANAAAFRAALEARLGVLAAADGTDLQSLRQQVSFDRLLARVCAPEDSPWLLKGGYAMVLRLPNARTTRDVDLSLPTPAGVQESVHRLLGRLQERARTTSGTSLSSRSARRNGNCGGRRRGVPVFPSPPRWRAATSPGSTSTWA